MSVAEAPTARAVVRGASSGARLREILFPAALLLCIGFAMLTLVVLLVDVAVDGIPVLSGEFITGFPSQIFPERSGISSSLQGTLYLMVLTAVFIVPVGVATAVYLEEYADRERWWNRLIEVNIQNLAAVPSIVYGILGLAFIVRQPLSLGPVVLAGALTLGLLVLPVVIVVSREAIRAVPSSIREGSMALGATHWQTIWKQTLPGALPGIATGVILALSRAIGETAPLILVGAVAFVPFNPDPNPATGQYSAIPTIILSSVSNSDPEIQALASGAIIVLMAILLVMLSLIHISEPTRPY